MKFLKEAFQTAHVEMPLFGDQVAPLTFWPVKHRENELLENQSTSAFTHVKSLNYLAAAAGFSSPSYLQLRVSEEGERKRMTATSGCLYRTR